MSEQWKPVVGYEGLYEVSDHGNVRSQPRGGTRGGALKLYFRPMYGHGYFTVNLHCNGDKGRPRYVHQLVLEAFVGPRPDDRPHTRHLDGDGRNNTLGNLCYGTAAENNQDISDMGRRRPPKTHCFRGHALTPENTRPVINRGRPGRACRACDGIRQRARTAERTAARRASR